MTTATATPLRCTEERPVILCTFSGGFKVWPIVQWPTRPLPYGPRRPLVKISKKLYYSCQNRILTHSNVPLTHWPTRPSSLNQPLYKLTFSSASEMTYIVSSGALNSTQTKAVPSAQTSSSQKFITPLMGNCTITYLAGGWSTAVHCRLTVAPSGTAPGYCAHTG